MYIINLERNYPRREEALERLLAGFSTAIIQGASFIKVIHGYGSSGSGGTLRVICRQEFQKWQTMGRISSYCEGESFHLGTIKGQALAKRFPQLKKDRDYGRQNDGITILVLR